MKDFFWFFLLEHRLRGHASAYSSNAIILLFHRPWHLFSTNIWVEALSLFLTEIHKARRKVVKVGMKKCTFMLIVQPISLNFPTSHLQFFRSLGVFCFLKTVLNGSETTSLVFRLGSCNLEIRHLLRTDGKVFFIQAIIFSFIFFNGLKKLLKRS